MPKASVQGGRELFHRLPPVPRLSGKNENSQLEEPDSGNEADTEPEVEEKCMWELNPLVMSINKLVDDIDEWYIKFGLLFCVTLAYFSMFASDSVPSDTSTKVDSDPWSAIDTLTSLHVPMKSSFETDW